MGLTERLPRPSRKLDAHGFYHAYLPELWNALVGGADGDWRAYVCAQLGAESYSISVRGKTLTIEDGTLAQPHITFVSDLDSFKIAMFDLLPQVLRRLDHRVASEHADEQVERYGDSVDLDRLHARPGRIRVLYCDDAGDEAQVDIVVGNGNGPTAELRAGDADLWALLEDRVRLSQLLRTRIRIDGDIAYVLSIIAIVEP